MGERTVAFRINEDLHRKLKIELVNQDVTLKDYIIRLIENDLNNNSNADISVKDLKAYAQTIYENSKLILEMTEKK